KVQVLQGGAGDEHHDHAGEVEQVGAEDRRARGGCFGVHVASGQRCWRWCIYSIVATQGGRESQRMSPEGVRNVTNAGRGGFQTGPYRPLVCWVGAGFIPARTGRWYAGQGPVSNPPAQDRRAAPSLMTGETAIAAESSPGPCPWPARRSACPDSGSFASADLRF